MVFASEKILDLLENNPNERYNAKTVSFIIGLNKHTVRKCLSKLEKKGSIIRESEGFYKGVKKYIRDIAEYFEGSNIDRDFANVIKTITNNNIPLKVHGINLHKKTIDTCYDDLDWKVSRKASKPKTKTILNKFGRTIIDIYKNRTTTNIPSCTITYSGDIKDSKYSLDHIDYKAWVVGVIMVLKSDPNINFNGNIDSFNIKQIGFNYDSNLTLNSLSNVRIKTLNDIYELYNYTDDQGKTKTRLGKHIDLPDNSNVKPSSLFPFLNPIIKQEQDINHSLNAFNNINQIQKDNTIMIELLRNSNDLQKTLVDTWPKIGNHIIKKARLETESVKKGIKQQNDFYLAEIDKINSDILKIHTGLRKVNGFIESQSAVIDTIIDSENRFKTEIIDVIKDNQNTSKQLIGKINKDKYKEYKFLFYLLQRQLHNLPEKLIEKLNESKLYLVKQFNKSNRKK